MRGLSSFITIAIFREEMLQKIYKLKMIFRKKFTNEF